MYIKSIDSMEFVCTVKDDIGHERKCRIAIPGADNVFLDELTKRIILNISSTDIQILDICETNNTKEEKFGRED